MALRPVKKYIILKENSAGGQRHGAPGPALAGRVHISIRRRLFRPSTDTFLLGSFPRLRRGMTVCELGAGTGLLSLLLLAREPELTVTGVELQPQACALFRRTAEENGLQGRMHYLEGDLRQGLLPPGRFRLAVANPPYFPPDAGAVAPDAARRTARRRRTAPWPSCAPQRPGP